MIPSGLHHHVGKFYGKHSGTVVANDQDKDNVGKIVVSLPTLFGAAAKVTARPCLPYGHFFVPPVGASVWVEFEGGDPDYPIWVGVWHPQGATPAPAAIAPPDNRVIQTVSGHTIEINDADGGEYITIKHKGNAFINIDKKGGVTICNQNGSLIHLDAENKSASVIEEHGNVVTLGKDGVAIVEKSGKTMVQLTDDSVVVSGPKIILKSPSISLTGETAASPTFLTDFLKGQWNAFAMHVHPTAMGPSGPPTPPGPLIIPGAPYISSGTVLK